jgi:hypothetical protein
LRRRLNGAIFVYVAIGVYIVIGVVVAARHHYFVVELDFNTMIYSAVLAVLLWPLILLGVNLHF